MSGLVSILRKPALRLADLDREPRGLRVLYRGSQTRCPGCHHSNWIVGRFSAECAFCHTALPIAPVEML